MARREERRVGQHRPVIQDEVFLTSLRIGNDPGAPIATRFSVLGARFFTATGIGLAAGRDFRPCDDVRGERVAIISESTARRYYPRGSPVGEDSAARPPCSCLFQCLAAGVPQAGGRDHVRDGRERRRDRTDDRLRGYAATLDEGQAAARMRRRVRPSARHCAMVVCLSQYRSA